MNSNTYKYLFVGGVLIITLAVLYLKYFHSDDYCLVNLNVFGSKVSKVEVEYRSGTEKDSKLYKKLLFSKDNNELRNKAFFITNVDGEIVVNAYSSDLKNPLTASAYVTSGFDLTSLTFEILDSDVKLDVRQSFSSRNDK